MQIRIYTSDDGRLTNIQLEGAAGGAVVSPGMPEVIFPAADLQDGGAARMATEGAVAVQGPATVGYAGSEDAGAAPTF